VIDRMSLSEAGEIFRYWEDNPPPHLMLQAIARLLGWQPARSELPPERVSPVDLAAAAPSGLVIVPAGSRDEPPAVFDIETLRARNRARGRGLREHVE
jgi:hypothetical protein